MASKIRILSEQTINQIAAGEVIEHPASVVKELIENAIDAGASRVTIEISAGGFQGIKISDDGSGMSADDAVLALERHATSKISSAADLFSIMTMGFRGEALASIAAIAKLRLVTALQDKPAVSLEIEGGKILEVEPAARQQGTTIEVRSLFFNVPARKKFQKSAATSSAEITKIVTQLALAHPEIGFELIQQNRTVFSLPSSEDDLLTALKARANALLSEEFFSAFHLIEFKQDNIEGYGLIVDPARSRHNRSGQYLFINRRPVFCLPLMYAMRDAYGTRLSADRHPLYVLHLDIPPGRLDVNVHPQKKEIRLSDEAHLKHILHQKVNDALGGKQATDSQLHPSIPFSAFMEERSIDFTVPLCLKEEERAQPPEIPLTMEINIVGFYGRFLLVEAATLPLFASEKGIVWFDLAAVDSRLQFEQLLKRAQTTPLSQGLLIPASLSFSRAETQMLTANLEIVEQLGIHLRPLHSTVFLVDAIPPFIEEGSVAKMIEEIIGELQGLEKESGQTKLQHVAARLCQRVRSRKPPYNLGEARQMIEELMQAKDPYHCPQGHKTLRHIQEEELESYFKNSTR